MKDRVRTGFGAGLGTPTPLPSPAMRISKKLAALCAFFVLVAVAVAGCGGSSSSGGSLKSGSVASVAGNQISKRAWTHWMFLVAKSQSAQAAQQGQTEPVIMATDPPHFSSCVKQLKGLGYKSSVLLSDCDSVFQQYDSSVLTQLIQNYWYQGVAHRVGVKVSSAEVTAQFNKDVKSQFKTTAAYDAYLKQSGYTNADIMWLERLQVVEQQLLKHFAKPITASAVSAYYAQNPAKFVKPATRDAHVLRVNSAAQAKAAYAALKSGTSWTAVIKRYEKGATSANNGGLLTDITDSSSSTNQLENAVLKVIFASPVGKIVGPTSGTLGFYVTEVTKSTPAVKTPFDAATQKQIRSDLKTQNDDDAVAKIKKLATADFGSKTTCRDGYAVQTYCSNYASAKPATIKAPPAASTTAKTTTKSSGSATKTTGASGTKSSKTKKK